MKKISTLLSYLIVSGVFNAAAQNLKWVKQIGAPTRATTAYATAVDATGNVYVTGTFSGTANFGGTSLTAISIDMYVAKYNGSGALQWVKQASGSGSFNRGYGIAVDASGNVYVTGYITNTTDFGGITLTIIGNNDLFIAKYNSSGTIQWVKQAGATGKYNIGNAIAVGASGNVTVTGVFEGTTNFGGTTLTAVGTKDIFVASYNGIGTLQWVNQAGAVGSSNNIGYGIATDANSSIYVTGRFNGTTNFGGTTITSIGDPDLFIASYNSAGMLQWVKNAGTPSVQTSPGFFTTYPAFGTAITEKNGELFVTGKFTGTIDMGGVILSPVAFADVFIAKYSTSGSLFWAKQIGKIDRLTSSSGIAADGSGNSYLIGEFGLSVDFGGTTLTSIGTRDAYIAKYNALGALQWVSRAGSTMKFAGGLGIAADAFGTVYGVGYFNGSPTFSGTTLSPVGNQDAFIWGVQATACPPALTPTGIITTNQKAANTVITTGNNSIPNAANVTYQGGNYVQLNPGFSAANGSIFTAKIAGGCQ
jgi:Beta-propeller repeat